MKRIIKIFIAVISTKVCTLVLIFLLLKTMVIGQTITATEIKNIFENYQTNHLQEKIFIHTDKTFYLAGETIWFKAYVVDAFFHRLLPLSKVLYVEIINKDLSPVTQTKIALDSAMGSGAISLSISINSGNYIIRAYTQWMKNFSADFYFEQTISIVNTVREAPLPSDTISKNVDVQFFPEGGNLVAGLTSKVAFKVTDKNGAGINCTGIIMTDKKDTVANFKSLLFGMGNFFFTPNKNERYKAILKLANNSVVSKDLPASYNDGYVLSLTELNDDIIITVSCTKEIKNNPLYFFAHSNNLIKSVQTALPVNGKAIFKLNKKDLAEGISHFTIFNGDKKPVCERLYFKQPNTKLFINTSLENTDYAARKNVQLYINTTDEFKINTAANLSLSVFLVDSLQSDIYIDIESYLLLNADLKGRIESPNYYFTHKNDNEAIDNLMLTQGWRRFNWDTVLQNTSTYFTFTPEFEGAILNGKIIDKTTGLAAPNTSAYFSVPNKKFYFFNAISNINGKIKFNLKNLYGSNEMITQLASNNNNYEIDIDNPFSNSFSNKRINNFNLPGNFKTNLLQRHIAMQVQHSYNTEENKKFIISKLDTLAFYGLPTYSFNLDAFTRFNTIEEVIKEFVTDVQLRVKDNKSCFRVYDHATQALFDNDPLLLIDGVPILDANKIVSFNPLKIKTIDVVSNKYYLGAATYNGIISFRTYDGDLGGYQLDPNAVILQYDGLQQQREFYSPKYKTDIQKESRIPDFRNVLYWDPNLKTGENGKSTISFYTSDITGKFAVVIQGITKNGRIGNSISTFNVK